MPAGTSSDVSLPLTSRAVPEASSPEGYAAFPHSLPRRMPSPYDHEGKSIPRFRSLENSTRFSSPNSNHWVQEGLANEPHPGSYQYAYPNPELVGDSPYRSYSRGTPVSDRSEVSVGDSRYHGGPQWTRTQATSKAKSKKKKKGEDTGKAGSGSDLPVSILSEHSEAPIHDIERFVNRSMEARHKEVEGKNGYRPRPMNNFMLYRKAYQERAKQVSSQNNHQVVSVVVAASWKHEAADIKDKFAKYAQIEKDNHIRAFPDYQFRPNKSQKSKKRKAGFDTDEEYGTDFDDPNDPDWERSSSKRLRSGQNRQPIYGQDFAFQNDFSQLSYGMPYHEPRSTYGVSHSTRLPQVALHEHDRDLFGNHMLVQTYADPLGYDDHQWSQIGESDGSSVPLPSQISGLPGAGDALLHPQNDFGPVAQYGLSQAAQLDPSLVTESMGAVGAFTQSEFENFNNICLDSAWEEHKPSLSAGAPPLTNHNAGASYDDEDFVRFLKSSSMPGA